jgi:hypothetical protein
MPNGVYPVPRFHASADRRRHGIVQRLRLAWHRTQLDEQLAAGVQPVAGTLLHDRAQQLGSRTERARLAHSLQDVLRDARRAHPRHDARNPLRTREIRECDEDILALIRRLEDERPVDVQGAAMAGQLLANPSGPLARAGETSLRYAVRSARLALDHADEASVALPEAA